MRVRGKAAPWLYILAKFIKPAHLPPLPQCSQYLAVIVFQDYSSHPHLSTMETLPIELVTRISFLACTDGGYTACSLSLVCRFVRIASRPARFYTVAFGDVSICPSRLKTFLSVYREEEINNPDSHFKVQHLFMSTFPLKGGELTNAKTHAPGVYTSDIRTLLSLIAPPTVETMTCIGFQVTLPELLTWQSFPRAGRASDLRHGPCSSTGPPYS